MKARVIETGEIIDVKRLYPTIYSRLDMNHRIVEEYNDDEIELIDKPKMVSIERACKWLEKNVWSMTGVDYSVLTESFKKAMEEQL